MYNLLKGKLITENLFLWYTLFVDIYVLFELKVCL